MRVLHFNGARIFFLFLFLHFFKGFFIIRYRLVLVWLTGVVIILVFMGVGFIGYVLVYSQISYWAAVVITRFLTVLPAGETLVYFIWGGFSVVNQTLNFFFVLHFLIPWLITVLIVLHLIFLHYTGRTSILYCYGDYDKIMFYPYFWYKDVINMIVFFLFMVFMFFFPFDLGDVEIFVEHNILASPVHIAPEWYFLFAYTILRAIPNKFLGVLGLIISVGIAVFFILFKFEINSIFLKYRVFLFIFVCVVLT